VDWKPESLLGHWSPQSSQLSQLSQVSGTQRHRHPAWLVALRRVDVRADWHTGEAEAAHTWN